MKVGKNGMHQELVNDVHNPLLPYPQKPLRQLILTNLIEHDKNQ